MGLAGRRRGRHFLKFSQIKGSTVGLLYVFVWCFFPFSKVLGNIKEHTKVTKQARNISTEIDSAMWALQKKTKKTKTNNKKNETNL